MEVGAFPKRTLWQGYCYEEVVPVMMQWAVVLTMWFTKIVLITERWTRPRVASRRDFVGLKL